MAMDGRSSQLLIECESIFAPYSGVVSPHKATGHCLQRERDPIENLSCGKYEHGDSYETFKTIACTRPV